MAIFPARASVCPLIDLGLRGRVAIVTGGSSGIGRATVRTLIAEGCFVAACARRAYRLTSLAAEVGDSERLLTLAADVTDPQAMQRLVGATVAEAGRIDAVAALARTKGAHRPPADTAEEPGAVDPAPQPDPALPGRRPLRPQGPHLAQ